MQPSHGPEAEAYREQINGFLDEHLPEGWQGIGTLVGQERTDFYQSWREVLAEHKLLAPNWPAEYGGAGLSHIEHVVLNEEFAKRGVPTAGVNDNFSIGMVGNTILQLGTDEQKAHYIPRILSGEDVWCQGYSEPDAGSDLANLGCRAELDGDQWIINGQKIWTSAARSANMIFVLARTDPTAPKHKGISFLLVPMDDPGIEIRPITNIAGQDHFNEVFFDDVTCPRDNVLGGVNNGWVVANTLLGFERGIGATTTHLKFRAELDDFLELARRLDKADDPLVRQRAARFHSVVEIMRYQGMQALTRFLAGTPPGPESSLGKLRWSHYHREITEAALDLLGPAATVARGQETRGGLGAPDIGTPNTAGNWLTSFYIARSGTIYAGTSEVQRNIIGDRILGLPREPRADAGSWKENQRPGPGSGG